MAEKITDKDIEYLETQHKIQKDDDYIKITEIELKMAKAVKELQDVIIKNDIH